MAKKSMIQKNQRRKKMAVSAKNKRDSLLAIAKDENLPFEDRLKAQIKLSEMPRNSAGIRYRNRCSLTGRPRAYYRKFALSRLSLRELASWGQIPGLIKSSW